MSSVESLFQVSGRAEGLFRSGSRDSLVRSASRESLTPLGENESSGAPAFDPPSDIESEAEDAPGNAEALSKEQLVYRLHRVEKSLANYRGKYSEVFKSLSEINVSVRSCLAKSCDIKCLRCYLFRIISRQIMLVCYLYAGRWVLCSVSILTSIDERS